MGCQDPIRTGFHRCARPTLFGLVSFRSISGEVNQNGEGEAMIGQRPVVVVKSHAPFAAPPERRERNAMPQSLTAIVGSAAPSVRTRAAVDYVCDRAKAHADDLSTDIIDLADVTLPLCDGRKWQEVEGVKEAVERVLAATSVLMATPIYRGHYTGALKNIIDWLPPEALENKRVGLIASGATAHHYLIIDTNLKPLLAWFNAVPVPGSVYITSEDMSKEGVPSDKAAKHLDALAAALAAPAPAPETQGPPSLVKQMWG
jgi:NAD(P)H-dependent FMN reductase